MKREIESSIHKQVRHSRTEKSDEGKNNSPDVQASEASEALL